HPRYVGNPGAGAAHLPLEERAALTEHGHPARETRLPVAEVEPAGVAGHVDAEWPLSYQLVADAGTVVGEDALPLFQRHVDVPRMRDPLSPLGSAGKAVALD